MSADVSRLVAVGRRKKLRKNKDKQMSQPQTCGVGCGDHGSCNSYGNCDCFEDEGWTGPFCNIPPSSKVHCVPSDESFQKAHGGGDKSCGNWGKFGVCNDDGTCSCGSKRPYYGKRCQNPSTSDQGCGAVQGATIPIGVLETRSGTCTCKRPGWSGPQCREVDEELAPECAVDADCGWGSEYNPKNVCNKETGVCSCATDEGGKPLFTGKFCQRAAPLPNNVCDGDGDCIPSQTCNSKTHVCEGGDDQDSGSDSFWENVGLKVGETIENMLLTEQGLENLALFKLGEESIAKLVPLLGKGTMKLLRLADAYMSEAGSDSAKAAEAAVVPDDMALNLAAEQTEGAALKGAEESSILDTLGAASTKAAEMAGSFMNMLMMLGMVIDLIDPSNLNSQMYQGQIDMTMAAMEAYINNLQGIREANIMFPFRYYPEETVAWRLQARSDDMLVKQLQYQTDYISKLGVNSNGQLIQPITSAQYALSAAGTKLAQDKKKYKVLYTMSGGNDGRFQALLKYGWIIWVLVALVGAAIVVSIVLIVQTTRKRPKNGIVSVK